MCEERLKVVLQAAAQRHAHLEPQPELLELLQAGKPPSMSVAELTPWTVEYQEELMRLLRWGDHEAVDYPVAGVRVLS